MARRPTPGTRDRLLEIAARLFEEHGVHAVGLQQIVDECGCGKNMLYREFASKDDLVVAWLEHCNDRWETTVDEVTRPLADDPAAQLVAIVKVSADEASAPGFRGCAIRATNAEFRDADHPAHKVSVEYLTMVRSRFRDLAERADAHDPDQLADRIMLIVDGLLTNGAALGPDGAAQAAVAFATDVVRAATTQPRQAATT